MLHQDNASSHLQKSTIILGTAIVKPHKSTTPNQSITLNIEN